MARDTAHHLSLQHFESIDLTLYLSITPRRAESLYYGVLILFQPLGETPKLSNSDLPSLGQPLFELPRLLHRDHPPETYRHIFDLPYVRAQAD